MDHSPRNLIQETVGNREPDVSGSSCHTIRSVGTRRNDGTKKKDYSKKKEVKKNKPAQPFKYFRDNYKERNQSCRLATLYARRKLGRNKTSRIIRFWSRNLTFNGQRGISCSTRLLQMDSERINDELILSDLKDWGINSSEDSSMAKMVVLLSSANFVQSLSPDQIVEGLKFLKIKDPEVWENMIKGLKEAGKQYQLHKDQDVIQQTYKNIAMGISSTTQFLTEKTESYLQIVESFKKGKHFKNQLRNYHSIKGPEFHEELKHWRDIKANIEDAGKRFNEPRITTYVCQALKSCRVIGEPTGPNESVADEWSDRSVFQQAIEIAIGENMGAESLPIDKMEWLWLGTLKDQMPEELQFISTFILVM